ncbi:MAG TPA: hypothetical protein VEL76_00655 [Gemmataceae bacterium]|nr:hypothetical protein [Gemmataceae bacterium]
MLGTRRHNAGKWAKTRAISSRPVVAPPGRTRRMGARTQSPEPGRVLFHADQQLGGFSSGERYANMAW